MRLQGFKIVKFRQVDNPRWLLISKLLPLCYHREYLVNSLMNVILITQLPHVLGYKMGVCPYRITLNVYSSAIKWGYLFWNNPKDLVSSFRLFLDLWGCFGRVFSHHKVLQMYKSVVCNIATWQAFLFLNNIKNLEPSSCKMDLDFGLVLEGKNLCPITEEMQ